MSPAKLLESHKYTALWHCERPGEKEWVSELFHDWIAEHQYDGKHEIVLDQCILVDSYLYYFDQDYYRQFRGKDAFLVHVLDENLDGGYEEIYSNFSGVFRLGFWSSGFHPTQVTTLPAGYLEGFRSSESEYESARNRKYLWTFVGDAGKASRPMMLREFSALQPSLVHSTTPVLGIPAIRPQTPLSAAACKMLLQQSAFVPCPMGNVQLECFRIYEALESGAIPILERRRFLDYFHDFWGEHPVPTFASWKQARTFVEHLRTRPDDLDELQRSCSLWWQTYKSQLQTKIAQRLTRWGPRAPAIHPFARIPGWRLFELARHHDTNALLWRVRKHLERASHNQGWRNPAINELGPKKW